MIVYIIKLLFVSCFSRWNATLNSRKNRYGLVSMMLPSTWPGGNDEPSANPVASSPSRYAFDTHDFCPLHSRSDRFLSTQPWPLSLFHHRSLNSHLFVERSNLQHVYHLVTGSDSQPPPTVTISRVRSKSFLHRKSPIAFCGVCLSVLIVRNILQPSKNIFPAEGFWRWANSEWVAVSTARRRPMRGRVVDAWFWKHPTVFRGAP